MQSSAVRYFGLVALLLALTSCASPAPDFAQIYGEKATRHRQRDRNPLIIVPGFLGSSLLDTASDTYVWGRFDHNPIDPNSAEGARLAALPLDIVTPLPDLHDGVVPDGLLENLHVKFLGLAISHPIYRGLVDLLSLAGYQRPSAPVADTGNGMRVAYRFDYDWRADIVTSARKLHAFVEATRSAIAEQTGREDIRFDIVAHSLGGLVTRYMLRYGDATLEEAEAMGGQVPWSGATHIDSAILVSPPNAGSLRSFRYLLDGVDLSIVTPRYPAAVLGTYPSLYQSLPRTRHRAVVSGPVGEEAVALDVFDPAVWERYNWGLAGSGVKECLGFLLPDVTHADQRSAIARTFLANCLDRAKRVHAVLDCPAGAPPDTRLLLFAGDATATESRLRVAPDGSLTTDATAPGDGLLLRSSALLDEYPDDNTGRLRSPVSYSHVTFVFATHVSMTSDPAFVDNLLFWLLDAQRPR